MSNPLDVLNEAWKNAEALLRGVTSVFPVEVMIEEGGEFDRVLHWCPYENDWHICLEDEAEDTIEPILSCSLRDRVECVRFFPSLYIAALSTAGEWQGRAEKAAKTLNDYIDKLVPEGVL